MKQTRFAESFIRPVQLWLPLIAAVLFSGCARQSDQMVLRMAHALDTTHPVHQAMEVMAEELKKESGGKVVLKIYPNGQLGSERESMELLQLGAIDLAKTSTSPLEGFVPAMAVFSVPYVFTDEQHYWSVLEGPIGQRLLEAGTDKGLKGLCYYDAGSRSFYSKNKPIQTPADLRGLKIRVQNSRTSMKMIEAMGGSPTPISWGELYTALDQGVVDGAENNPQSLLTSRHYEVCKFYSLDEHTRVPDIILVSTKTWDRLTPEVRQMLQRAADVSSRFQRELWHEETSSSLARLVENGVKISHPDKKPFQQAVESLHASYNGTEVGKVIDEIRRLQ